MKKLKGQITITRPMGNNYNHVRIMIKDENSRAQFIEVEIKLDDFTRALTGQGAIPMEFTPRGLHVVGKIKEVQKLDFPLPPDTDYTKYKEVAKESAYRQCYEGFTPDLYFGSQNSFERTEHGVIAHTTQYRYVEPKED